MINYEETVDQTVQTVVALVLDECRGYNREQPKIVQNEWRGWDFQIGLGRSRRTARIYLDDITIKVAAFDGQLLLEHSAEFSAGIPAGLIAPVVAGLLGFGF